MRVKRLDGAQKSADTLLGEFSLPNQSDLSKFFQTDAHDFHLLMEAQPAIGFITV
jgi:hypothetical protein